jgi:hypothetical protein
MTITREKIAALLAMAGFLLIVGSYPRLGAVCMLAVFVLTVLGVR